MTELPPKQLILVGDHQLQLPDGVTVSDWALERVRWQNPRIRAFLGCIRLLGGVLESNYSILHCSPERLLEILRQVREVAELLRAQVAPLLGHTSVIEELETARQRAEVSYELLEDSILQKLDALPEVIPASRLLEVRKLLCVSIGQLHGFLNDTFGEIMATDPRSLHDADYFISHRFPQDVDEAEWLHATVVRLRDFVQALEEERTQQLAGMALKVRRAQAIPSGEEWERTVHFLKQLAVHLTPKLREVLALRGIRFSEMEVLDRYAFEIPSKCDTVRTLQQVGRTALARLGNTAETKRQQEQASRTFQTALSSRMVELMEDIDRCLRDLMAFIPLWLEGIENRRALLLRRSYEESAVEARQRMAGRGPNNGNG